MKDIEQAISSLFKNPAAAGAAVIVFKIIVGLILLWICSRIIELICRRLVRTLNNKESTEPGAVRFLGTIIKIVLYLIVILLILNGLGYKTTSLLTVLGSVGLAIVLGLKDSLSNVASGFMIMILKPFKVGDHISENSTKCEGTVIEIGLFFTKLKTLDEKMIVIPNQILTSTSVVNHTAQEYRTLDLHYSIPYGTNLVRAKDLIRSTILADQQEQYEKLMEARTEAAADGDAGSDAGEAGGSSASAAEDELDKALFSPENIHVFVYELAESSVIVCSRSRVKNEDYWPTRYRLLEDVYNNFKAAGIDFAYPHMDVHIDRDYEDY